MGNSSFNLQDHVDHLLQATFHFLKNRVKYNNLDTRGVLLVGERYREEVYQSFQQHKDDFEKIGMDIRRQGVDGEYDEGEWCTLKLDEYFESYERTGMPPPHELLRMGD